MSGGQYMDQWSVVLIPELFGPLLAIRATAMFIIDRNTR